MLNGTAAGMGILGLILTLALCVVAVVVLIAAVIVILTLPGYMQRQEKRTERLASSLANLGSLNTMMKELSDNLDGYHEKTIATMKAVAQHIGHSLGERNKGG